MRFSFFTALVLFLFASMSSEAASGLSRSEMLVAAFAKTCLSHPGKPQALKVAIESAKQKLPKMPSEHAKAFLGKYDGHGWVLPPQIGKAVLIIRNDGPCTIFVRRWGDASPAQSLEDFFNDNNSLMSLQEKQKHEGKLSTQIWGLYPAGKYKAMLESKGLDAKRELMGIVLSTSDDPNGNFQLALTLEALNRENK